MIKSATLLGFLLGGVLAVCVFIVKYEVQDLEAEYFQLNTDITEERQSIHVLLAEWSHLNEPSRLRTLAREHLNLNTLSARQMGGLNSIPRRDQGGDKDSETMPMMPADGLQLIQAVIQEMAEGDVTQ
ncbi:MAG: hypothetical protein HN644_04660 [Rhodospirillales bacterium]|jgi:cell division protein FtsL|nr:hypothetical protein [Rhodospirillales bacterium]MBT4040359.1 hypothetical protein [Rhodospirillales bacterium]MBT4625333.1 hypothetical protein [Rhodospirillales bacterium]MBT5353215.1 hypothetical protein [Rhodospirillales bacterium]MBT5519363.1 hypothetical protein [Rhodospirillales bacterium]